MKTALPVNDSAPLTSDTHGGEGRLGVSEQSFNLSIPPCSHFIRTYGVSVKILHIGEVSGAPGARSAMFTRRGKGLMPTL